MAQRVSTTTHHALVRFSNAYNFPHGMLKLLQRDILLGLKYKGIVGRGNLLRSLRKYNLVTKEISTVARRIGTNLSHKGDRSRRYERMILDLRIATCDSEASVAKKKWGESSLLAQKEMLAKVRPGVSKSLMINRYKRLKWVELRRFWYKNSARLKRKLGRIKNSR